LRRGCMQRTTAIGLLLVVLVFAVYGRTCTHEFTYWDDPVTVHQNPRMNPPTLSSVLWYWGHAEESIYMPLTHTLWGVLASAAYLQTPNELGMHLNPWVFHTANVAVHSGAVIAVYALLLRLFGQLWPAAAGALLFGLHPVQVEAVGWVSGMKDLLCGMFAMIALWQYAGFALLSRQGQPGCLTMPLSGVPELSAEKAADSPRLAYAMATVALVLSMLSKPTGMIVPVLAAIVDYWLVGRPARRVIKAIWPWLLLSAGCAVVARIVQPGIGLAVTPLWTRPLIAGDTLAFYLYKLVFPAWLAVDYGRLPQLVMKTWWVWFAWIVPAAVGVILWLGRRDRAAFLAGGLLFVGGILPVLGVVRFAFQFYSTTADHYLYPSMLGPAVAVAWVLSRYGRRAVSVAAIVVLIALGAWAMRQAGYWSDALTLWEHNVEVNPRSYAGHVSIGNALSRMGRAAEAGAYYRKSVQLNPRYVRGLDNLAMWLIQRGELSEAVGYIRDFLRVTDAYPAKVRPDNTSVHYQLGCVLLSLGRLDDAMEQFRLVLDRQPSHEGAAKGLEQASARHKAAATRPATLRSVK